MDFQTLLSFLGMLGSMAGGAVVIILAALQGLLLFLRAINVLLPTEAARDAKRLVRSYRIRSIGKILSADGWHGGRNLEADEPQFLRKELAFLIEEELADLRSEEKARKRKGVRAKKWEARATAWKEFWRWRKLRERGMGLWKMVRAVFRLQRGDRPRHEEDGTDEANNSFGLELPEFPLERPTGVISRHSSATRA